MVFVNWRGRCLVDWNRLECDNVVSGGDTGHSDDAIGDKGWHVAESMN